MSSDNKKKTILKIKEPKYNKEKNVTIIMKNKTKIDPEEEDFTITEYQSKEEEKELTLDDVLEEKETISIHICSWNLKNFGSTTPKEKKESVAILLKNKDIIAVQEIRSSNLIKDIHNPYIHWRFIQNTLSGKDNRQESMGFFYNADKVDLLHYRSFDQDPESKQLRYKPMSATFTLTNNTNTSIFTILNIHVGYTSDLVKKQTKEEQDRFRTTELSYIISIYKWLKARKRVFGSDIFICGDFNLEPDHKAFDLFKSCNLAHCISTKEKTTVGVSRNSYDNFWVPSNSIITKRNLSNVANMELLLNMEDKESRNNFKRQISDHLPVSAIMKIPINT